jgi:hypothetical protein
MAVISRVGVPFNPAPTIAANAIRLSFYALAANNAALHKDQAFQASSPKTFQGRPFRGLALFFVRDLG